MHVAVSIKDNMCLSCNFSSLLFVQSPNAQEIVQCYLLWVANISLLLILCVLLSKSFFFQVCKTRVNMIGSNEIFNVAIKIGIL